MLVVISCFEFMSLTLKYLPSSLYKTQCSILITHGWATSQSRQSTKPFFQSSELGQPQPLTRRRVCVPPTSVLGVGAHSLHRKRGVGRVPVPTTGHSLSYIRSLWLYMVITGWKNPLFLRILFHSPVASLFPGYRKERLFSPGPTWECRLHNKKRGAEIETSIK
jgi:hypothetical protein